MPRRKPGRNCFACDDVMTEFWWGWMCIPCEVLEFREEAPARASSYIDPDTKEEVPYLDHSAGNWPSPA